MDRLPPEHRRSGALVATARGAGNVIGGSDWANDRLAPDIVRVASAGAVMKVRYPNAVRRWQCILDPIAGCLQLAERLQSGKAALASPWNFGPSAENTVLVHHVIERFLGIFNSDVRIVLDDGAVTHEAQYLRIDTGKAHIEFGWRPRFNLAATPSETAQCYSDVRDGIAARDACEATFRRMDAFI